MKLSEFFWLSEFTRSQTATRHGIRNKPTKKHLQNLIAWANNIGDPIRRRWGRTNITSGYRSHLLNSLIGGSNGSQHSKGEAGDFECEGGSNLEVAKWIRDNLIFDQLILEFWDGEDPYSGWIHCSYRDDGKNRGEVLQAIRRSGKTHYIRGLPE